MQPESWHIRDLWSFITRQFLPANIRPGFGLVPGTGSDISGLALQRGSVLWEKTQSFGCKRVAPELAGTK